MMIGFTIIFAMNTIAIIWTLESIRNELRRVANALETSNITRETW